MNLFVTTSSRPIRKEKLLEDMWTMIKRRDLWHSIDNKIPRLTEWRKRIPSILLLKVMILQFVFWLSDEAVEEDIHDRNSFKRFLWEELLLERWIPDSTTLCRFRKTLDQYNLHEIIFKKINECLIEKWCFLKRWTIVDATIVRSTSSTKNQKNARDPEMKSTKKWANYYFGMKVHQWTDADTWLVHTITCTPANVHDSQQLEECLHWEEKYIWWDKAYHSKERLQICREHWITYWIIKKATRGGKLSIAQKKHNIKHQSIRSKVERPFRVIKKRWKQSNVRYRGIRKNEIRYTIWLWLWNLILWKWYLDKVFA
jgi:IS5 family transposase